MTIQDLRSQPSIQVPPNAVLVIGSGAAGLALAERLSALGRPVVLLESGGDVLSPMDDAIDDRNAGMSTGLAYTGLTQGRSRVFGGTGQLWHGQCMRLHDVDLVARPWVARSGWPIGPTELAEHYPAAERWLGVSGRGYGAERWAEHPGLPPVSWNPDHLLHDFTEYAPRHLLGQVHRAGLAQDPSVLVLLHATVAQVTTDATGVTGVAVVGPDGGRVPLASSLVVLAAGAVENARLLQLSDPAGIGLGDGRALTGRYLQDHPIVRTAQVQASDYRLLQDRYVALHRGSQRLFPKVRLAPAAQEKYGLLDATAVFLHEHRQPALASARRLLIAARTRRRPENPIRDALVSLGSPAPVIRDGYRRYVRGLSTGAEPSAVWLQLWLEQAPDADSRITLSTATDRLGLRRAQVHWRTGELELETSRRLTRWIGDDLKRLGIGQLRELDVMHDDAAWHAGVTDAFHPAGTTRMSHSPRDGVVDVDLQVHGVAGLFAVGGSVFPTSGYANPTLTIVALALRLAERLAAAAAKVAVPKAG